MDKVKKQQRHRRVRSRVHGTTSRPRVSVYRSIARMQVQIVDDMSGKTLLAMVTDSKSGSKIAQAEDLGKRLAQAALKQKISQVVFDRGGYLYHGRVKALAEAMRLAGLEF